MTERKRAADSAGKEAVKHAKKVNNKPERLQCEFFVAHKKRQCRLTRKAEERFCAEHLKEQSSRGRKRVPCPLSSGHTVWEDQLKQHVRKCQRETPRDPWFQLDVNLSKKDASGPARREIAPQEYQKWAEKAAEVYSAISEPVEREVLDHPGLKSRLSELQNQKHAIQQASLIGHMDKHGLLADDAVVAEFGCGRGELSRYIARSQVLNQLNRQSPAVGGQKYLLVDRAGPRNKLDAKIAKDLEELEAPTSQKQAPQVARSKIDIKDLDLGAAISALFDGPQPVSVVSKHLCGCATDLTLRCLANAGEGVTLRGVAIALCCRQLCNFGMYPDAGREWLQEHGITAEGFAVLAKMTSWAVCGTRSSNGAEEEEAGHHHPSGYSEAERRAIGLKVRRVIDYGRLVAVRASERMGVNAGYDAKLVEYVDPSVSLENICLLVHRRADQPPSD